MRYLITLLVVLLLSACTEFKPVVFIYYKDGTCVPTYSETVVLLSSTPDTFTVGHVNALNKDVYNIIIINRKISGLYYILAGQEVDVGMPLFGGL